MSTTTLRLPDELKQRIIKLAEKSGKTAHGLMLDAIAQKVEEEEIRASFHHEADARFTEMIDSGVGLPWHDMRAYLQTRASGNTAKTPKARRWRK